MAYVFDYANNRSVWIPDNASTNLGNGSYAQPTATGGVVKNQNVLGTNTTSIVPTSNPNPTQSVSSTPGPVQGYIQSLEDQLRGQINSNYDNLMSGLEPQRQAQEQIVNNTFNQGVTDLGFNRDQGLADLNTQSRKNNENQVKTLNDLSANLKNAFQAGNVYLGARGAGDSSAANQYSYALTNMANKNRGNILSQTNSVENDINDRRARLNNIYTQESTRLATDKQNQLLSVAQWFSSAQNQLRQLRGQDLANVSAQVLNQALAAVNQIAQENSLKNAALQSWALARAQTTTQATQALNLQANYQAPAIQTSPLTGTPRADATGNYFLPAYGYGGYDNDPLKRLT